VSEGEEARMGETIRRGREIAEGARMGETIFGAVVVGI
jgi:hypothetical protein